MTPTQIQLVRDSWQALLAQREAVAALFYEHLFALAPQVRPLFKRDMRTQGAMLMATLVAVVDSLDRLPEVLPVARQLAIRHVAWGVKAAHYDSVGAALLATLEKGLGDAFTPALKQAWAEAYASLAAAMKEAAYPNPVEVEPT
jgi:hemoglobin-like flavoprotein